MTSADVVMKACGLRFEEIQFIASKHGVEMENAQSRSINEDLLFVLANAHIRLMQRYFFNSKRHVAKLSATEYAAFMDFCDTFKKEPMHTDKLTWNDIDTDAIRKQFVRNVHDLTPDRILSFRLFAGNISISLAESISAWKERDPEEALRLFIENNIINCVIKSRWLYVPKATEISFKPKYNETVRMVTLSARYYVFPEEDHHIACFLSQCPHCSFKQAAYLHPYKAKLKIILNTYLL